jgi:hypothetical protein
MSDRDPRRLPVIQGQVRCTPDKTVPTDLCRLCAHSVRVVIGGKEFPSPARAYCTRCRDVPHIKMEEIEAIICDDIRGEGFRSIANIIS